MSKKFPHLSQPDVMDCGATCLAMIAKYYGKNYTIQKLRDMCSITRAGVSMLGISDAAEKLGFKTIGVKVNFEKLAEDAPLPCIVHWKQEHFVVVNLAKILLRTDINCIFALTSINQNSLNGIKKIVYMVWK